MVEPVSTSALGYFIPILAFLLVFIIVYALLAKTKVLGEDGWVMLFVSLIIASFFVMEISLVEFVRFSSAWFSVLVVSVFFILILLAFMPWKDNLKFLEKGNWFSIVVLLAVLVMLLYSSAYVFNWAINWDYLTSKSGSDWFGFVLLLAIAGVVSWTIKGGKK